MVTTLVDLLGILLITLLLPVWMALGLGFIVVVMCRQLYWWARGNTTPASRSPERVRSWPQPRASWLPTLPESTDRSGPVAVATLAGAQATPARVLASALPAGSQR